MSGVRSEVLDMMALVGEVPHKDKEEVFDTSRFELTDAPCSEKFVRRSCRAVDTDSLNNTDVKNCIKKLLMNDASTVVFRVKDHVGTALTPSVLDEILTALSKNKVCQALYIQNVSEAMLEKQFLALIDILKQKRIWALNIGENYKITRPMWETFCKEIPNMHLSHIYVSEHVITTKMKDHIRDLIRENRKKHNKHCNKKNMGVIQQVTNMWWNPINHFRRIAEKKLLRKMKKEQARRDAIAAERKKKSEEMRKKRLKERLKRMSKKAREARNEEIAATRKERAKQRKREERERELEEARKDPQSADYYKPGGDGYGEEWYFKCKCGELCSWWENPLYHPKGEMFECDICCNWSHVVCMKGTRVTIDDIEEQGGLCFTCESSLRRLLKYPDIYITEGTHTKEEIDELRELNARLESTK